MTQNSVSNWREWERRNNNIAHWSPRKEVWREKSRGSWATAQLCVVGVEERPCSPRSQRDEIAAGSTSRTGFLLSPCQSLSFLPPLSIELGVCKRRSFNLRNNSNNNNNPIYLTLARCRALCYMLHTDCHLVDTRAFPERSCYCFHFIDEKTATH